VAASDADALLLDGAIAKAAALAEEHDASLVSPEQDLQTWYEKRPFVYLRLAHRFH
jgi:hypothetical protein